MQSMLIPLSFAVALGVGAGAQTVPAGAAEAVRVGPQGRAYTSIAVQERGEPRSLVPGTAIRLTFTERRVTATAGCNTLSGPAEVTADAVVVTELASTRMGCEPDRHEQDRWLADFLKADPYWSFGGGALFLRAGDIEVVLGEQLPTSPQRPLLNRYWIVDTLMADRVMYPLPPGIHVGLLFRAVPDGSVEVTGALICNWLSGTADLDASAGTVDVSRLTVTERACSPDDPRAAAYLFAALRGTSTFWIDGDQLTIAKPTGPGLIAHAAF